MKIGIQQNSLFLKNVFKSAMIAARAGAQGLGITLGTMVDIVRLGIRSRRFQFRLITEYYNLEIVNFRLECLCEWPSLVGPGHDISDGKSIVRTMLWTAAEAGVPSIIVPFFRRNRIECDCQLRRAGCALAELSEEAHRFGVVLAVESDLSIHHLNVLLGQSPDRLKVALNTGHLQAKHFDLVGLIRELGLERLDQVQMRNVRVVRGAQPQFDALLDRGNVDFRDVVRALEFIGFDNWLNVDTPPGDERSMIAATNIAFARGILADDGRASRLA